MYACAGDGPNDYLFMLIATSRMWDTLCAVIDRPDLIVDPKYATPKDRAKNADELDAEISKWTRKHEKHEAMRILAGNGVPVSAVFDSVDVFNDPHLTERGFFKKVDHPVEATVARLPKDFEHDLVGNSHAHPCRHVGVARKRLGRTRQPHFTRRQDGTLSGPATPASAP